MHAFFCCGSHVLCFYQNVGLGPVNVGCAFSQSAFRCSGRWNDDSVAVVGYGLGLCFLSYLGLWVWLRLIWYVLFCLSQDLICLLDLLIGLVRILVLISFVQACFWPCKMQHITGISKKCSICMYIFHFVIRSDEGSGDLLQESWHTGLCFQGICCSLLYSISIRRANYFNVNCGLIH